MTRVKLVPGSGVVSRSIRFLTWSADDSLDLQTIISTESDEAFKKLAAAVLAADFNAPPFVVVDFDRQSAFISGGVVLETSSGPLDGSTTSTWIEARLESCADIAVNGGETAVDDVSDLVLGTVRAGGWVVEGFAGSPPDEQAATPAEANETPVAKDQAVAPIAEEIQLDQVPPSDDEQVLTIDLLESSPTQDSIDPFSGDVTVTANIKHGGPPTLSYEQKSPPGLQFDEGGDGGDEPLRPMRSPGKPQLRATELTDNDLNPSPRRSSVHVSFDDGQQTDLERGLLVGRHPTKNGLPVGYQSITIRGEHVSRVHWELDLSGESPLIRDLGSMSGLVLRTNDVDKTEIRPNGEAALTDSVRVEFADRWADIKIK